MPNWVNESGCILLTLFHLLFLFWFTFCLQNSPLHLFIFEVARVENGKSLENKDKKLNKILVHVTPDFEFLKVFSKPSNICNWNSYYKKGDSIFVYYSKNYIMIIFGQRILLKIIIKSHLNKCSNTLDRHFSKQYMIHIFLRCVSELLR